MNPYTLPFCSMLFLDICDSDFMLGPVLSHDTLSGRCPSFRFNLTSSKIDNQINQASMYWFKFKQQMKIFSRNQKLHENQGFIFLGQSYEGETGFSLFQTLHNQTRVLNEILRGTPSVLECLTFQDWNLQPISEIKDPGIPAKQSSQVLKIWNDDMHIKPPLLLTRLVDGKYVLGRQSTDY